MKHATKLDRLNELLKQECKGMNLPTYRMDVPRSGSNLAWLKKVLAKEALSEELHALLQLPITQLTR